MTMTIMMSINGSISGTFVCGNLDGDNNMTTMAKIIGLTMVTMVTRMTKITV